MAPAGVAHRFDPLLGALVDSEGVPIPKKVGTRPKPMSRADFTLDTRSVFDKDRAMLGGQVERDEDGYLVGNAGRKFFTGRPRKIFRRGTHWRVVREGARIEAMCFYGKGANGGDIWSGWSRRLPVGTVLECIGWRRFRRDGLVAPQFVYDGLPSEAKWSTVWPLDGIWRPWPLAGLLEEVDGDE